MFWMLADMVYGCLGFKQFGGFSCRRSSWVYICRKFVLMRICKNFRSSCILSSWIVSGNCASSTSPQTSSNSSLFFPASLLNILFPSLKFSLSSFFIFNSLSSSIVIIIDKQSSFADAACLFNRGGDDAKASRDNNEKFTFYNTNLLSSDTDTLQFRHEQTRRKAEILFFWGKY